MTLGFLGEQMSAQLEQAFPWILLMTGIACGVLAAFLVGEHLFDRIQRERRQQEYRQRLSLPGQAPEGLHRHLFEGLRQKKEKDRLLTSYERDFPSLLEVVSLGMHAGLSFDAAFELYASRFSTPLACACNQVVPSWSSGIITRDDALRTLVGSIELPSFSRFVSLVLRSIHFGAPIAGMLGDLADEARKEYRAEREKRVAKAPVRMLIPTAACILPAMLLLVLGPVILELVAEMG